MRAVGEHERLKRAEDSLPNITLTLVGDGPERNNLESRVQSLGLTGKVKFLPPQPIERIREFMRENDLYVLSSNSFEGWGAVVSEALEEGMKVVGTYEAGSSSTILPKECLYHSGDYKALARRIASFDELPRVDKTPWTVKCAAKRLVEFMEQVVNESKG